MVKKNNLPKEQEINKIAIFEGEEIRKVFFDDDWYFVIEDVVRTLTDTKDPKGYIKDIRRRDEEISQGWGQIATPLPFNTSGGKQSINCANTEGVLRIIQSIPSKKAEPFKRWLARVGKERLDEIEQPAKAIERAKGYYLAKGYSPQWVETRTASVETRHKFTDTLKDHGITKGYQYAVLTNEMYKSWSDFTAKDYKTYKGISISDSLRDNMTPLELATTIFNEATITEIIEKTNAEGFIETRKAVHVAGSITKEAITKIEKQTGKKVVTHENAKELDGPEIRKELAQNSLPKTETLSDFNENLKTSLNYNPKKKS